jgi:hypothetical protein
VSPSNLIFYGNFFRKLVILNEAFRKRAYPSYTAPRCTLNLGNQPKQNTAIGCLEAGRSQVRENYLVLMNLSRLGDRPVCVMRACPERKRVDSTCSGVKSRHAFDACTHHASTEQFQHSVPPGAAYDTPSNDRSKRADGSLKIG